MTDNPTALPLTPEELVIMRDKHQWFASKSARWVSYSWSQVGELLATITAKDAEVAAQAETIERQDGHLNNYEQQVARLKRDYDAEVATLKAEVAALREALLDMRSIVIGYWSMDMTPAEIEADKTMTKARAALSPKEA